MKPDKQYLTKKDTFSKRFYFNKYPILVYKEQSYLEEEVSLKLHLEVELSSKYFVQKITIQATFLLKVYKEQET